MIPLQALVLEVSISNYQALPALIFYESKASTNVHQVIKVTDAKHTSSYNLWYVLKLLNKKLMEKESQVDRQI
jgi:hypothetical protein